MKKKLFGYLVLALAVVGTGLISSCRDYEEDVLRVKAEMNDDNGELWDTVNARYTRLKNAQANFQATVNNKFADYKARIDSCSNAAKAQAATDAALQDSIDKVAANVAALETKVENALDSAAAALNKAEDALASAAAAQQTANDALDSAAVAKTLAATALDSANAALDLADSALVRANEAYDSAMVAIQKVDSLAEVLKDFMNAVKNVEEKRITSLYVQGALNPTFGYFSLPLGIKSNILMAYYGKAENSTKFPVKNGDNVSAVFKEGMEMTAAEFGRVNPEQKTVSGNLINSNNSLGKIFFTVNPNEVELDTTYQFTLVNSLGEDCVAKIDSIKPSDYKLQFGYGTRAAANGFYEGLVTVDPAQIEALKPEMALDKEQLKTVATNLKNRQLDVTGVAGIVNDLLKTKLDAYALKTTWTDTIGTHTITSYYDIAATAVKPLSFTAMDGFGSGYSSLIPEISPIGDLSLTTPTITVPSLGNVNIGGVTISISNITLTSLGAVNVTFSSALGTQTVDLSNLQSTLQNDLNAFTTQAGADITAQVNALINTIQTEINNQLASIQGQMQTTIDGYLSDYTNAINAKINNYSRYIDLGKKIINKVSALSSKVSHAINLGAGAYLQPMIAYEAADGSLHPMSTKINQPSTFVGNGSIMIYPTSYSAELLAPAYMKYVAVVNAWANNDASMAPVAAEISAANSAEYFNEVFDGGRFGVAFSGKQGYTYEIYYSAIDYDGYISAKRFYVTVK